MTRYYTATHEWVLIEGNTATVGISKQAPVLRGELVFISLPRIGRDVLPREEIAVLESVTTTTDVYAPLTGTITDVNTAVTDEPALVNHDPLGAGWLVRLHFTKPAEIGHLLSQNAYRMNRR